MTQTLATLLKNPDYRDYFRRSVKYPAKVYHPSPWRVWVQKTDGKWGSKTFRTYSESFQFAVPLLKRTQQVRDVAISSRLIAFRAPENLRMEYQAAGYDWCVMCRRPVHFVPMKRHHALRNDLHCYYAAHPVCPYCGIREETILSNSITYARG